ncbi:glycosyltransferase [Bacillus sp. UMB0899]|nr:glycosyltransferase [Bacillus sp. UMB0899]
MIIDIVLGYAEGRGGLEAVLTVVSQGLVKRGHRVRVFFANPPTYSEWEETLPEAYCINVGHAKKFDGELVIIRYSLGYRKLMEVLGKPDVIIATHEPMISIICNLAVCNLGTERPPIVSWLHGPPEAYPEAGLIRYSDSHLAISNSVGEKIRNYVNVEKTPIYYIGNPVEIVELGRINRSNEILQLLYIGRMDNHQKRLDILLEALSKICGNWRLTIIGDGRDKTALQNLAINLGIFHNITWLGWKKNPWAEVSDASILLLSSDYEGFGLVLVEALGRGVPVISTNCEGPDEIIQDGVNGWTYQRGNSEELATILQSILDGKTLLPSEENCVESVRSYSVNSVLNRLEKFLLKIV